MNQKKYFLDMIHSYAYNDYEEAKSKNEIVFESLYDNGFIFIRNNEESYGVRISFVSEMNTKIYDVITPYLYGEKEVYFIVNYLNKDIIHFLTDHCKLLYHSYEMQNHSLDKFHISTIQTRDYEEQQFHQYIDVLGEGFVPIRRSLGLEPYNWYQHYQEEAKQRFTELSKNKNIKGYFVNDELIGVIMVDDQEIDTICVRTDYQKQGIGGQLLLKAIQMIKEKGYNSAFLGVLAENQSATELYQKHGFEITGGMSLYIHKNV